jgi:hypothetical protein
LFDEDYKIVALNLKVIEAQFDIRLDHENKIVHVVAHGDFVRKTGEEIITKARLTALEHLYHILFDARKARTKATMADWYFMPRQLNVFKKPNTHKIKTALLISRGKEEKAFRFYENVSRNLGRKLKVFFSEEEAMEWLKSTDP